MKIKHKAIYKGLLNMVKWTKQFQKEIGKMNKDKNYSPMSWLKEMSTVKFCLPRQSGHSTFARKLFLEELENPIYFFPSKEMLKETLKRGLIPRKKWDRLFSARDIKNNFFRLRGMKINSVIIDCAVGFSKANIFRIYNFLKENVNSDIIVIFLE